MRTSDMTNVDRFVYALKSVEGDFFAGVSDSLLKSLWMEDGGIGFVGPVLCSIEWTTYW